MAAKKSQKSPVSPSKSPAKSLKASDAKPTAASAPDTKKLQLDAQAPESKGSQMLAFKVLAMVLAFVVRFWRIGHPDQVVFDEVHFGKFASHYLQREYYFDLHPPLAKLMYAAVGWLVGYDGKFKFDNIGDNYIVNEVPYIAYRSLAAFMGAVTVPLVFGVLEHCGMSAPSCFLGAALVIFDTAQVAQTRLILLDAALIFFMMGAVYSYVRFREQRRSPFSRVWWLWLGLTGFFLSCVMSTKYVGLFTYLMIGIGVLADLCMLADIRGKPEHEQVSLRKLVKHFMARLYTLVVIPFVLYLWWFYVHFAILTYSGPGNSHMSPEFQATLQENPLVKEAYDLRFFDNVTIKQVNTEVFLHSHPQTYPMQYEDGRISSQGQQVTGYSVDDVNNVWQILPPVEIEDWQSLGNLGIVGSQQVMLRHVATDSYLLTHDVASPGYPTNEEFTTVPRELAFGDRHEDVLFTLDILSGGDKVRTKLTQFRLKHVHTSVVMWLSDKILPEWGFQQREINGNKKLDASGSTWYFASVESLGDEADKESRRSVTEGSVAPRRGFWTDYLELQATMFRSNNQLTVSHPYMSSPWEWPLMLRGISFWSSKDEPSQIYLVGNYFGWYLENTAFVLFVILYAFDKFAILRNIDWLTPYARYKLDTTILWLFLGWAVHYFPFFLMGRQLFLHHYLPAQVLGAVFTAALVDFILGQVDHVDGRRSPSKATYIVIFLLVCGVVGTFAFFAPLVYGLPISPEAVRARQLFDIQLHYNK